MMRSCNVDTCSIHVLKAWRSKEEDEAELRSSQESEDDDDEPFSIRRWWSKFEGDNAMKVDIVSRGLFPLVFAIFNILYWSVYLSSG